jgi:hypothetical protein
MEPLD